MRSPTPALLAVAIFLSATAYAQSEPPPPSGPRAWFAWFFGPRDPSAAPNVVHPSPRETMLRDQRREMRLEQKDSAARIAADKQRRLIEMRREHDRQIAGAIANNAPSAPFRASGSGSTVSAGDVAAPATSSLSPLNTEPPHNRNTGLPPAPRPKTIVPPAIAEAVDQVVDKISETIFDTPAAKPTPSGLFTIALIGMFLVPGMGLGLVLVGFAHVRGHSFTSGTVIITLGALILWGSFTAARMINPELLTRPKDEPSLPADAGETPTARQALRAEAPWNNY